MSGRARTIPLMAVTMMKAITTMLICIGVANAASSDGVCFISVNNTTDEVISVYVYNGSDWAQVVDHKNNIVRPGNSWDTYCGSNEKKCAIWWHSTYAGTNTLKHTFKFLLCNESYDITKHSSALMLDH